jgi:hypothetical protein
MDSGGLSGGDWAAIASAAIAVVAFIYTAIQGWFHRREARTARTLAVIRHLSERLESKTTIEAAELLEQGTNHPDQAIRRLNDDRVLRGKVAGLLNEFEQLGALYFQRDALDRNLVKLMIQAESQTWYEWARWLTDRFRQARDQDAGQVLGTNERRHGTGSLVAG